MTTALVTGFTGFIGRHLSNKLEHEGIDVFGITRNLTYALDTGKVLVGDIKNAEFVSKSIEEIQPDVVYHLAANKSRTGSLEEYRIGLEDNLFGTLNLIESCVKYGNVSTFISIGTCEEYGNSPCLFKEDLRESPVSAYSLSKMSVTHLLEAIHKTHNLPTVIIRPSLAYGPGQERDMFLPTLIRSLLDGQRFPMSEGSQTRDYIYVDDLVQALLLASKEPLAIGRVINVGSGTSSSMKDVAKIAAGIIGEDAEDLLDIGKLGYRANEIMEYRVSSVLASELLNWRAKTSLYDGLRMTVEYYRSVC